MIDPKVEDITNNREVEDISKDPSLVHNNSLEDQTKRIRLDTKQASRQVILHMATNHHRNKHINQNSKVETNNMDTNLKGVKTTNKGVELTIIRVEGITIRVEGITTKVEGITTRVGAIIIKVEVIIIKVGIISIKGMEEVTGEVKEEVREVEGVGVGEDRIY